MNAEKGTEKKSFLTRLVMKSKTNKTSCCCNIELEEVPEDKGTGPAEHLPEQQKKDS